MINPLATLRNNQEGMAATSTVIVISVMLILMAAAILRFSRGFTEDDRNAIIFYNTAEIVKANIYTLSVHPGGWNKTVTQNQAAGRLTCIGTASCGTAYQTISLVDANNTVYYDPATQGFDRNAKPCTFNSASAAGGCIMKASPQWRPFCSAACQVPPFGGMIYVSFSIPTSGGAMWRRDSNEGGVAGGISGVQVDRINGLALP